MALPNSLAQISDLGSLLGLTNNLVDIPLISAPYTTITNRANIYDLSKDLGVRMGINRIQTQQIYKINDEFGPNGESIWGAVNDKYGQIRLVGQWANQGPNATGQGFVSSASTTDYLEITFYGTGLNILTNYGFAYDIRAKVNNGSEGSNLFPASSSFVLGNRNYTPNQVLPVVSGLTLGTYTVFIRNNFSGGVNIYGFEIINNSSSITVNPGTSWKDGKKLYNASQATLAYNSGFESGVLGSRGGRVSVYQKSDGSFAKALTPTGNQATLGATDHSSEEVYRTYSWLEFCAGRTDDFSSMNTSLYTTGAAASFALDDGATMLTCSAGTRVLSQSYLNAQNAGDSITFTFVGTGIDLVLNQSGATNSSSILIDNVSLGAGSANLSIYNTDLTKKIASGLPYGTHTVKILTASATNNLSVKNFIVYRPKTPTIPTGAIQHGAYNILADYSPGTAALNNVSTGVIRKSSIREFVYVGSNWTAFSFPTTFQSGFAVENTGANNGQYVEYTFWGTGIEYHGNFVTGNSYNQAVTIDGISNLSSIGTATYVNGAGTTGMTFTASTGVISGTAATASGLFMIRVSGLTLGLHKIRVTQNAATSDGFYIDSFDVITPIHSNKDNGPFILQNTMEIGNQSVEDNRRTLNSLFKSQISQAKGINAGITTSMTSSVPMPDMSTVIKTSGGDLEISFNLYQSNSTSAFNLASLYVDGILQPGQIILLPSIPSSVQRMPYAATVRVPVGPGYHKVDVYWNVNGGTGIAADTERVLTVKEIKGYY